jgi:hypothetical protein
MLTGVALLQGLKRYLVLEVISYFNLRPEEARKLVSLSSLSRVYQNIPSFEPHIESLLSAWLKKQATSLSNLICSLT